MIISVSFILCLNILIPLYEGLSYKIDYRSSTEDISEENRSDPYANDDIYQKKFGKIVNEI